MKSFIANDEDMFWWENHHGSMGSAHSISGEPTERDPVEALRDVVEEVTRRPVPRQQKRMGFL